MAKKKKNDLPVFVVQSKVKEYIREYDMMCASDLTEALNESIGELLDRALERTAANNRKTARAADI